MVTRGKNTHARSYIRAPCDILGMFPHFAPVLELELVPLPARTVATEGDKTTAGSPVDLKTCGRENGDVPS